MSRQLRWGILATGNIARSVTRDLLLSGHAVTAVGSRRAEAAEAFAAEYGIARAHGSYEALVTDPEVDAVYVATPHPYHLTCAALALEADKHVLLEKPFTINAAEAETLVALARKRQRVILEAMWTRYLPHMRRIREIINAGTLGSIRSLSADHTQALSADPEHRLNALALGGGALLDLGIYPVSFIWDILGEPELLHAQARFRETGADSHVSATFRHANGAISNMVTSSEMAGPNRAQILGSDAYIDIDGVWFAPTTFRVIGHTGEVLETYRSGVPGQGRQFQVAALEQLVAEGQIQGDILPPDETVAIMSTLDRVREHIGLRYPME